jgi:hypothetical protein
MCSVPSVGSGPTCWQSSRWYVVKGIHSIAGHQQLDVARCVDASDFCDQRAGQAEATLDPPQADLGPPQPEYAAPVSTPVTYGTWTPVPVRLYQTELKTKEDKGRTLLSLSPSLTRTTMHACVQRASDVAAGDRDLPPRVRTVAGLIEGEQQQQRRGQLSHRHGGRGHNRGQ